jgi:hypothetical protein
VLQKLFINFREALFENFQLQKNWTNAAQVTVRITGYSLCAQKYRTLITPKESRR